MLKSVHLVVACLLLTSHSLFFIRGLYIHIRERKPLFVDWLARLVSQVSLVITAVTGLALSATTAMPFLPHGLLGLLPVATIPLFSVGRLLMGRRKELPWLLPAINFVLILLAFGTGFG